jgi:NADH:ubiquinone reductase (non-electrogenic)
MRFTTVVRFLTASSVPIVSSFVALSLLSQNSINNCIRRYANIVSFDNCDVAVFGGGFGGLYTALSLSEKASRAGQKFDIALVEPSEQFCFLPLLYDLTIGTATESEVCPYYKDILAGTGIRQIRASLDRFDDSTQAAQLWLASVDANIKLSYKAAVISVGSSPESILRAVPGAIEYAQPFYTATDARQTRLLLHRLEGMVSAGMSPRVAIVGGGYAGVELAASVQRKITKAEVTLIARQEPLAGTRAEPLVNRALQRLRVQVRIGSVQRIEASGGEERVSNVAKYVIETINDSVTTRSSPYDAILWTAGTAPASPISDITELNMSESGRLATDSTLRCQFAHSSDTKPMVWALGDCAEIVANIGQPAVPRTAQAAMQQSDVVASNIVSQLSTLRGQEHSFKFQDLGTMLTLGGPNGVSEISNIRKPEHSENLIFLVLLNTRLSWHRKTAH